MTKAKTRARASFLAFAVAFVLVLLPAHAHADTAYVRATALAKAHGLKYHDLSTGAVHACKLAGKGHEVVFFAGMRNILLDTESRMLAHAVVWNGESLMVPAEAARIIAARLGEKVYRPKSTRGKNGAKIRFTVVIDAGHGGRDPGAVGRAGTHEKFVNLDIARKLAAHLKKQGVKVVMTRKTDVYVSLDDRVRIANKVGPDLFVSIHANAEPRPGRSVRGAMTLYPDNGTRHGRPGVLGRARTAVQKGRFRLKRFGAGGRVGKTAQLAVAGAAFETYRVRSKQVAQYVQEALSPVTGCFRRNKGIIEDPRGLHVLRNTHAPAVLVEVDFLSNPLSERKLRHPSHRTRIAKAIGRAVIRFRNQRECE